ncbi:hypothetical protein, partial [Tahibacter harae]
ASSARAVPPAAAAAASAAAPAAPTLAQQLAGRVAEGCALNLQGRHAQALAVLESALEFQRSEPALRHSDDYRVGVLAAAIARHGAEPSADTQERLQHELTRESWLGSDAARAAWREQAAAAARLGVKPVQ